jgi:ATP-dependent RNA helicase MSS116
MFGALRRCPASLSRALPTAGLKATVLRTPLTGSSFVARTSPLRVNYVAVAAFHQSAMWQQIMATQEESEQVAQDGPVTRFKDLATRGLVHPNVINTITKQMKLETMTEVQTRTINEALSGTDMYTTTRSVSFSANIS